MPAVSSQQRRWAFAAKGPAWARAHHFDTPGPLPRYVQKGRPVSATQRLASRIAENRTGSGPISAATRARTATFTQPGRQGGETHRFPMPDKKHARLALQMLPRAKGMPPGAAAKVRARANAMLGN